MGKQRISQLLVIKKRSVLALKQEVFAPTISVKIKANDDYLTVVKAELPLKNAEFVWLGEFSIKHKDSIQVNGLHIVKINSLDSLPMGFLRDKEVLSRKQLEEFIKSKQTTPQLTRAVKLLVSQGII